MKLKNNQRVFGPLAEDIRVEAATRAVSLLNASGVQFKVVMPDGTEFGSLSVTPARERKKRKYKHGSVLFYARKFTDLLQKSGDRAEIPIGAFDVKTLRSTITAHLSAIWGNGSYISSVSPDSTSLNILRIL